MSKEAVVRAVFAQSFEPDGPARYYPHSVTLTGGQTLDANGETYRSFIHEALKLVYAPPKPDAKGGSTSK